MAQSGYYSINKETGKPLIHFKHSTCAQDESVLFRVDKGESKHSTIYPMELSLFPEQLSLETLALHTLGLLSFRKHLGDLNTVIIEEPCSRDTTLLDLLTRYVERLSSYQISLQQADSPDLEFKSRFDRAFKGEILPSVMSADEEFVTVNYLFDLKSGSDAYDCFCYRNLDVVEPFTKDEYLQLISRMGLALFTSSPNNVYKLVIGFVADVLRGLNANISRDIPTLVQPDLKTPFVLV